MNPTYLTPYPYSLTIFTLLTLGTIALITYRKKIDWYKYTHSILFSFILGVAEIHNLENHGNVASWYFPDGSALLGVAWGRVYWEDILFVPACFSIFYLFMWWVWRFRWVRNDALPKWTYQYLICAGITVQALIFQVAGKGIENLIIAYTLVPLAVFVVFCIVKRPKLNITHLVTTLVFVSVFSMSWELVNVHLQHWTYDTRCGLMGPHGWFLGGKLHVGIFFQYAYTGTVVVYGSGVFFDRKTPRNEPKE